MQPTAPTHSADIRSRWVDVSQRALQAHRAGTLSTPADTETTPRGPRVRELVDHFERISGSGRSTTAPRPPAPGKTQQPNPTGAPARWATLMEHAAEAREVLGNDDDQVIPGIREYFFPEEPAPLKGLEGLQKAIFGPSGIVQGLKEIFVERRVGRGFAKILASAIFIPFQTLAVIVDLPRLLGDKLVNQGKALVVRGIADEGIKQSLLSMAGGALQMLGGVTRLALPATALCLGFFAGGWPGVIAAAVFEAVYFGEDVACLRDGNFEDMLLFKGLRDIVGGLSTILGAEFIPVMNKDVIQPEVARLMGSATAAAS